MSSKARTTSNKVARMAEAALSRSSSVKPTEGLDGRKLPSWPDSHRGVPNILLRSALFSSSRSSQDLVKEEIFAQSPTRIRYTGPQLNQADHDVWITLLHLARGNRLNLPLRTSAYSLLKLQHKTDTGANRKNLYKCLAKLETSKVEIIDFRYPYTGSLVDATYRDESTEELVVVLNPALYSLFDKKGITWVDWSIRRLLNSKPLAQWLHGYYSSHAEPFPVSIKTLMQMAGSTDRSTQSAEQNLRRALDSLAHARATHQKAFSYRIHNGNVHVEQVPSDSQLRHLQRKSKSAKGQK